MKPFFILETMRFTSKSPGEVVEVNLLQEVRSCHCSQEAAAGALKDCRDKKKKWTEYSLKKGCKVRHSEITTYEAISLEKLNNMLRSIRY